MNNFPSVETFHFDLILRNDRSLDLARRTAVSEADRNRASEWSAKDLNKAIADLAGALSGMLPRVIAIAGDQSALLSQTNGRIHFVWLSAKYLAQESRSHAMRRWAGDMLLREASASKSRSGSAAHPIVHNSGDDRL